MPGIVGIISRKPAEQCRAVVRAMASVLAGEEAQDFSICEQAKLGLFATSVGAREPLAAMPVASDTKKSPILLSSGECFFDGRAVELLLQKGHKPGKTTAQDLLHLYEEEGRAAFQRINGLFSGLLIDSCNDKAFLFNDRFGVDRVYVCQSPETLYFASQAKAILRVVSESRQFDPEGVGQFLAFGCTLHWRSLFKGISILPGGSLWCFEPGKTNQEHYFEPRTWETQEGLSEASFEEEFRSTFKRVLPRYFASSAGNIGISLTAGLDTRMIMACCPAASGALTSYTFAGEKGETLDATIARRVAQQCGLEHSLLRVGSDFFTDFGTHVDRTVYQTDGNFGLIGAHEIYLNRQAHQLAPVRLTGNFGSEILRGVSTFKPIGLSAGLVEPSALPIVHAAIKSSGDAVNHPITFAAFREIPWALFGSLAAGRSEVTFRTPYLDNEVVALAYRAPESLRRSPRAALALIKQNNPNLFRIPTDRGLGGGASPIGIALRRVASDVTFKLDYVYNEGLPHWLSPFDPVLAKLNSGAGLLGRHKYLHYRRWFRTKLAPCVSERLNDQTTLQLPFLNSSFVRQMAADHLRGRRNYVAEINAALTLAAIQRLLLKS